MRLFHILLGTALVLSWLAPEASAQYGKHLPPQTTPPPQRQVFQNQRQFGPPIIARGTCQPTRQDNNAAWNVPGAKRVRYDGLDLKIISGSPQRRLATVNDQTFVAGETLRVNVKGDSLRVRCLEIRERSALFAVHGEENPRELKLQAWQ